MELREQGDSNVPTLTPVPAEELNEFINYLIDQSKSDEVARSQSKPQSSSAPSLSTEVLAQPPSHTVQPLQPAPSKAPKPAQSSAGLKHAASKDERGVVWKDDVRPLVLRLLF